MANIQPHRIMEKKTTWIGNIGFARFPSSFLASASGRLCMIKALAYQRGLPLALELRPLDISGGFVSRRCRLFLRLSTETACAAHMQTAGPTPVAGGTCSLPHEIALSHVRPDCRERMDRENLSPKYAFSLHVVVNAYSRPCSLTFKGINGFWNVIWHLTV